MIDAVSPAPWPDGETQQITTQDGQGYYCRDPRKNNFGFGYILVWANVGYEYSLDTVWRTWEVLDD